MSAVAAKLDDLLNHLREQGARITTARRVVLAEVLAGEAEHLTADEVAARIRVRNPDIHLSTVYRTLDFLAATGVLTHVRLGAGPSSYHLTEDSHHHAVCESCGQTIELPANILGSLTRRLERDYGFHARPLHLAISGTCGSCYKPSDAG